jgi:hypothetical protein
MWQKCKWLIVAFFLNINSLYAQDDLENHVPDANVASLQPKIFFQKSSIDFGQAFQGQKLSHKFLFENIGEAPLVIHGVHASCGCTAVEVDKAKPYQPGEKGTIEVIFDTANFSGSVTKVVTVMTNQRLVPDRTLVVKANVIQEIGAVPPIADFGELLVGESKEQKITIKSSAKSQVQAQSLKFNKDLMDAQLDPAGPNEWKLTVKLKPGIKPDFIKESIAVVNTSKNLPELQIPIRAKIKSGVATTPDYLEFGAIARGDKIKRTVTISGVTAEKIKNAETTLNINGEKVTDLANFVRIDKATGSKDQAQYTVELINHTAQPGNVHGRLIFKTDDIQTGEVPIDFYAFFR